MVLRMVISLSQWLIKVKEESKYDGCTMALALRWWWNGIVGGLIEINPFLVSLNFKDAAGECDKLRLKVRMSRRVLWRPFVLYFDEDKGIAKIA
ncbi:unnamed protein product [Lupinus luteus]|uniref:Uncharacterized protein n=1 Tax=Lupinus luteus TaxID=3873 RepID=A0AAV1XWQ7_LUPLU